MTREQLTKRIDSIMKDVERLENTIRAVGITNVERYPEEYRSLSGDAVRRAEWLACRLRHMLYETPFVRKPEYLLRVAEAQGIKFDDQDGVFQITLPGIALDHSKKCPSEFLRDPLYAALSEYFKDCPVPRYRHCVVSTTLVFSRELPGRVCLDMSSPELKLYLDVAASYLLIDDSPKYLDAHHSVELGDRDAIKMIFMERDHFPEWLRERQRDRSEIGPEWSKFD